MEVVRVLSALELRQLRALITALTAVDDDTSVELAIDGSGELHARVYLLDDVGSTVHLIVGCDVPLPRVREARFDASPRLPPMGPLRAVPDQ
jgi:hypothetical protein